MPTTQTDIRKTLLQFYHSPVAAVSLELFLSLAAIIFFLIFAILPTIETMSDLIKEIDDKKQLQQQLERKIAALATIQTEYLQLKNQLVVLDQALPNQPQLIQSLKVIEKIASDQQLAIDKLDVHEIPTEDASSSSQADLVRTDVPITISVTGSYPTIRNFVESLLEYRRSFVVDTIVFSSGEEKGVLKLSAAITLYLPYYKSEIIEPKAANLTKSSKTPAQTNTKTKNSSTTKPSK